MKKTIAVVLAACLLCAFALPAGAETCYEVLKGYVQQNGDVNLGSPITITWENKSKYAMLAYSEETHTLVLGGTNLYGKDEVCYWENVSSSEALVILYALCNAWSVLEDAADVGYTPVLGIRMSSGEDLSVSSAYEAKAFVEVIENLVKGK